MADYEAMAALKRLFVLIYIHRLRTDFGVYAEMNEVMVCYTRNIFRQSTTMHFTLQLIPPVMMMMMQV
jgi:hypothetical protein